MALSTPLSKNYTEQKENQIKIPITDNKYRKKSYNLQLTCKMGKILYRPSRSPINVYRPQNPLEKVENMEGLSVGRT